MGGHLEVQRPGDVAVLESPYEQVDKVDASELNESKEDRDEAHDDEDVQGCGISDLRLGLATKPHRHNGQVGGRAEGRAGRGLLALLGLLLEVGRFRTTLANTRGRSEKV